MDAVRDGLNLDNDLTFAYSRLSCVSWMYPIHILTAYLLVVFGIFALVCRVWEKYKSWHGFFGRCFMVTMYWGYGTSLLIHRFGLTYATIIFMATKLACLSIGFFAIRRHAHLYKSKVMKRVFAAFKSSSADGLTPDQMMANARKEIDAEKTTFASRFLTLKGLHGVTMTYAWYTMLGRVMATNPDNWEGCWTHPAVKSDSGPIEYVPREDPGLWDINFDLAFGFGLFSGGLAMITIIGAVYSYFAAKKANERRGEGLMHQPVSSDAGSSSESGKPVKHKNYDSMSSTDSVSDVSSTEVSDADNDEAFERA